MRAALVASAVLASGLIGIVGLVERGVARDAHRGSWRQIVRGCTQKTPEPKRGQTCQQGEHHKHGQKGGHCEIRPGEVKPALQTALVHPGDLYSQTDRVLPADPRLLRACDHDTDGVEHAVPCRFHRGVG